MESFVVIKGFKNETFLIRYLGKPAYSLCKSMLLRKVIDSAPYCAKPKLAAFLGVVSFLAYLYLLYKAVFNEKFNGYC